MVKIGDILVGHYGYSMEIYNFYLVVNITEKSISLLKLKKRTIGGENFRPKVIPVVATLNGEIIKAFDAGEDKFTRRLSNKSYVSDESKYGIIYIDKPITSEQLANGFQEDHLD